MIELVGQQVEPVLPHVLQRLERVHGLVDRLVKSQPNRFLFHVQVYGQLVMPLPGRCLFLQQPVQVEPVGQLVPLADSRSQRLSQRRAVQTARVQARQTAASRRPTAPGAARRR